ncbi:hypothetical protein BOX15_Mlig002114g4 [Macrostomum lignano]|uniref:Single-stranded DNA-binding protein n=3 Tax=Macrostomum lignano TaxID=282301 RepID=A0A1I8FYV6_9PLAT|nr:hypothetical protein BOX15_Mlig002114g4 [Macrostomum lignano]
MLSAAYKSIARQLLQQQQPQRLQLLTAGLYTWDGKNYSDNRSRRQPGSEGGELRAAAPRDYNEIRLRGTVTKIFQANNRGCRFILCTKKLYRKVNPGGSWRWAESTVNHYVFGGGVNLPSYLPYVSVGSRIDMSAIIFYQERRGPADSQAEGANAAADAEARTNRQANLRLNWLKPVEEEEMVDISFDVQLDESTY